MERFYIAGRRRTEGVKIRGARVQMGRWCRAEKMGLESIGEGTHVPCFKIAGVL